jgi:IS4 transposase
MPSSVVVIAVVEDGETPQATLHNLDNMSAAGGNTFKV